MSLVKIGVWIKPGLRTFTRMRRDSSSAERVLASDRTAAFVAL
jgi:hypothetical protein